jgi:hypothetical protein
MAWVGQRKVVHGLTYLWSSIHVQIACGNWVKDPRLVLVLDRTSLTLPKNVETSPDIIRELYGLHLPGVVTVTGDSKDTRKVAAMLLLMALV